MRPRESKPRSERSELAFFLAEIETGLAFARLALSCEPRERERLEREKGNARLAYASVVKFLAKASLSPESNDIVQERLGKLRLALQRLGEPVA